MKKIFPSTIRKQEKKKNQIRNNNAFIDALREYLDLDELPDVMFKRSYPEINTIQDPLLVRTTLNFK